MHGADVTYPLEYANARTPIRRRPSRIAVASAVIVAVTALTTATLIWLANSNRLPGHFLCCKHPALTFTLFVLLPGSGTAAAVLAVVRIARHHDVLKGLPLAIPALLLNALLAFCGFVLFYALKA